MSIENNKKIEQIFGFIKNTPEICIRSVCKKIVNYYRVWNMTIIYLIRFKNFNYKSSDFIKGTF